MSDLVGNPEDQFSQNEAHIKSRRGYKIDRRVSMVLKKSSLSHLTGQTKRYTNHGTVVNTFPDELLKLVLRYM